MKTAKGLIAILLATVLLCGIMCIGASSAGTPGISEISNFDFVSRPVDGLFILPGGCYPPFPPNPPGQSFHLGVAYNVNGGNPLSLTADHYKYPHKTITFPYGVYPALPNIYYPVFDGATRAGHFFLGWRAYREGSLIHNLLQPGEQFGNIGGGWWTLKAIWIPHNLVTEARPISYWRERAAISPLFPFVVSPFKYDWVRLEIADIAEFEKVNKEQLHVYEEASKTNKAISSFIINDEKQLDAYLNQEKKDLELFGAQQKGRDEALIIDKPALLKPDGTVELFVDFPAETFMKEVRAISAEIPFEQLAKEEPELAKKIEQAAPKLDAPIMKVPQTKLKMAYNEVRLFDPIMEEFILAHRHLYIFESGGTIYIMG